MKPPCCVSSTKHAFMSWPKERGPGSEEEETKRSRAFERKMKSQQARVPGKERGVLPKGFKGP